MIAKCTRRCWDGKKARRYYPGDQDDIDPKSPIAKFFDIPKEEPKVEEDTGPTKKEIMAKLDELGIEYKSVMNKAELTALLP